MKLSKNKLPLLKIKNPRLNAKFLNELENSETGVGLKQFLLKNRIYNGNLRHLLLRMANVKSISSHCRRFQLTIFPSQATIVADIVHELVAPILKSL